MCKPGVDVQSDPEEERDTVGQLPPKAGPKSQVDPKDDASMVDDYIRNIPASPTSSQASRKRTARQAGITPVLNLTPVKKWKDGSDPKKK